MAQWLKQLTAGTIAFGPFVGTADGFTPGTALTISQADIQLSKNGGTFAQVSGTANLVHMANGYYALPLGTADVNTLGRLRITSAEAAALPVWQDFVVVSANVFDSLIGGGDVLDVSEVQINGTAVSTTVALVGVNVVQVGTTTQTGRDLGASVIAGGGTVAVATSVVGGTITAVTNPVSVSGGTVAVATSLVGGTVTAVTNPVTVSGGTVAVVTGVVGGTITSVTNPVTVSGGTVNLATTVTSVTNPVTTNGGTVSVVTGVVGGTITAVTNPVAVSSGTVTSVTGLTVATIDTQLSSTHGAGSWVNNGSGGTCVLTYTLTSSGDSSPIPSATVELYSDIGMATLVDSQTTNVFGVATFSNLVAGTYYLKRIKTGWSFSNPDSETVA